MASPEQVIESYIMQAAIQYSQSHGFSPENEHEMKEFLELNMDNILVLAKKMMFDVLHKLENKETRDCLLYTSPSPRDA